tara:strand:- start:245 stop:616 length:372 start_codon:yes stop_codon:yes gene_type:complete
MNKTKYASTSFLWSEIMCKCGCGNIFIQDQAIDKLQKLRDILQIPLIINSAARCPIHNAKVGGAPKSQHRATKSRPSTAFDISLQGVNKQDLIGAAKLAGFKGLGINYNSFVHVDNRKFSAVW